MTSAITQQEAKLFGYTKYFTGLACKNGHVCERWTSSRSCVECMVDIRAKGRFNNIEVRMKREQQYRDDNREAINEYAKIRYQTHREWVRSATDKWRENNLDKDAAKTMRRKARLLKACPSWVDFKAIEVFYTRARKLTEETGIEHQVDHIYPLQGEFSCGLHVPWNLQILTKSENAKKRNKIYD